MHPYSGGKISEILGKMTFSYETSCMHLVENTIIEYGKWFKLLMPSLWFKKKNSFKLKIKKW